MRPCIFPDIVPWGFRIHLLYQSALNGSLATCVGLYILMQGATVKGFRTPHCLLLAFSHEAPPIPTPVFLCVCVCVGCLSVCVYVYVYVYVMYMHMHISVCVFQDIYINIDIHVGIYIYMCKLIYRVTHAVASYDTGQQLPGVSLSLSCNRNSGSSQCPSPAPTLNDARNISSALTTARVPEPRQRTTLYLK